MNFIQVGFLIINLDNVVSAKFNTGTSDTWIALSLMNATSATFEGKEAEFVINRLAKIAADSDPAGK